MTTPRPICGRCGKPYGQRATDLQVVKWKTGDPKPAYRGNGIVVKESIWSTGESKGSIHGLSFNRGEEIAHRWVWDGETWCGGYKPFCTLRCALDYARKVYARDYGPYTKITDPGTGREEPLADSDWPDNG